MSCHVSIVCSRVASRLLLFHNWCLSVSLSRCPVLLRPVECSPFLGLPAQDRCETSSLLLAALAVDKDAGKVGSYLCSWLFVGDSRFDLISAVVVS